MLKKLPMILNEAEAARQKAEELASKREEELAGSRKEAASIVENAKGNCRKEQNLRSFQKPLKKQYV